MDSLVDFSPVDTSRLTVSLYSFRDGLSDSIFTYLTISNTE